MWANFTPSHYLTSAGLVVSPNVPGEKEQHLEDGCSAILRKLQRGWYRCNINRDGAVHAQRHRKTARSCSDFDLGVWKYCHALSRELGYNEYT